MKNLIIKAWRFLVLSSADPKRTSLTVKGFGLMFATVYTTQLLPTLKVVCELGYLCDFVSPSFLYTLNNLIELATSIVYYALMTLSILLAFVGTFRKAHRTVEGTNLALRSDESME